jgi:hypothetical protein
MVHLIRLRFAFQETEKDELEFQMSERFQPYPSPKVDSPYADSPGKSQPRAARTIWSESERRSFYEELRRYGPEFKTIAFALQSKTKIQVIRNAMQFFRPSIKPCRLRISFITSLRGSSR